MKEKTKEENFIIETIDEEGKIIKFELFDIVEFEDKEYALLLPAQNPKDDDEVVLMRLKQDGEDYLFEAIESDEEFDKVAEFIESLDVED
ncbi:MAG TPA: DUF1292 domain-containing protein [Candidatus Gastranaerophilaceae bacterium]|nr:DUF1292 domain-containing protein [Candidatus Gastranaerophilaceae bacterium]HPT42124.1 DUF1292 domain-containing protein [Candidatus Gastranaerophilaceae bacterium]